MNTKDVLTQGGVYLSDNVDSGKLPFVDYVFYVVETFEGRDASPRARIIVLEGDDKLYPAGSMHVIKPYFWIWSGSWRVV